MKKLIPPALFIICILLMISIEIIFSAETIIKFPYNLSGIALILSGLIIIIKVRKEFDKQSAEIHTFKKPQKLVTGGFFRLSRNPIYLGFSIALFGVWVVIGNVLSISGVVIFILITNIWYIPYEENAMFKEFGEDYIQYKSKVRRWL